MARYKNKRKERGLSRADSRYTVFWTRHEPSILRCGFPTIAEAREQAEQHADLGPINIIDLITYECVWDSTGAPLALAEPSHRVGGN